MQNPFRLRGVIINEKIPHPTRAAQIAADLDTSSNDKFVVLQADEGKFFGELCLKSRRRDFLSCGGLLIKA